MIICSGVFLKVVALFLYAWFISTSYVANMGTSFISLDSTAGKCQHVPLAVTNTFEFDVNGHWNNDLAYNPSLGLYTVDLNNFLHSTEEYALFMQNAKYNFETYISAKAPSQDLATNLLYWMTYSYFVEDGVYSHRWRTSGDPAVVFDRLSYLGSLGNKFGDCTLPSTVSFNRATGQMRLKYDYMSYTKNPNCLTVLDPDQIGYNAIADGSNLHLSWDVTSLILARAVNKGIVSMEKLVNAKSGFFSEKFTVNGVVYTKTTKIDPAYPNMNPIICFQPNLVSSVPTAAPTSFAYVAEVGVSQVILGVSLAVASSSGGKTGGESCNLWEYSSFNLSVSHIVLSLILVNRYLTDFLPPPSID